MYLSFSPFFSGADSSSHHSPPHVSLDHRDQTKKDLVDGKRRKGGAEEKMEREAGGSSSIEEEILTAANNSLCSDSIPSVVDEKGKAMQVSVWKVNSTFYMFTHSSASPLLENEKTLLLLFNLW